MHAVAAVSCVKRCVKSCVGRKRERTSGMQSGGEGSFGKSAEYSTTV